MRRTVLVFCISTALVVVAWAEPSPAPDHITSRIPGNRSNRARSQRLAAGVAVTFSKSNSLTALLPLFRHPAFGASRPDVGGVKSALLRFQCQETLSFGFGSAAGKGAALGAAAIVALPRRVLVARPMFCLAAWVVIQASAPLSNRHPCLFRDAQAGKPAPEFRLEAEVGLWLKRAGISNSMK